MPYLDPSNSQSSQLLQGIKQTLTNPIGRFKSQLSQALTDPTSGALMGGPWGAAGAMLYHGTKAANANSIVRQGFDLGKFGTGADSRLGYGTASPGFLGRGIYGSTEPEVADLYASMASPLNNANRGVVKFHVPDASILDLSQSPIHALQNATYEGTTDAVRPITKAIRRFAKKQGKSAVTYPGDETVVYDPRAIDYMERYK